MYISLPSPLLIIIFHHYNSVSEGGKVALTEEEAKEEAKTGGGGAGGGGYVDIDATCEQILRSVLGLHALLIHIHIHIIVYLLTPRDFCGIYYHICLCIVSCLVW